MKAFRPWIGMALLAPMLVLAVTASSFFALRCRMSSMLSPESCCPAAEAAQAPAQPSMGEPGCCERVVVESAKPIADAVSDADSFLRTPMLVVAPVPDAFAISLPRIASIAADADPPAAARLSFCLLYRSLLI
jgi:hypothetical protein